jgi:hypothetical protein
VHELEKYLTSKDDCGGASPEELRHMGKTAAIRYVRDKTPLNNTIGELAKESHLNLEQIKRVVEHANNATFSTLFQAGFSSKNIQFPMADTNAIAHESHGKEKTASSLSALLPTTGKYIPGQENASVEDLFSTAKGRMAKLASLESAKEAVREDGKTTHDAVRLVYPNWPDEQVEKLVAMLDDEIQEENEVQIKSATVKFLDLKQYKDNLECEKLTLGDQLTEGLSSLKHMCKEASVENDLFAIGAAIESAKPSEGLLAIIKEEVDGYAEFGSITKLANLGMALQQNPITGLTTELEGVSQKLVMAQDAVGRTRMAMSELLEILRGPSQASPAAQVFGASGPPQGPPPMMGAVGPPPGGPPPMGAGGPPLPGANAAPPALPVAPPQTPPGV